MFPIFDQLFFSNVFAIMGSDLMKSVSIKEMVKTLIVHTKYDKVDVQSV